MILLALLYVILILREPLVFSGSTFKVDILFFKNLNMLEPKPFAT